MACGLAQGKAWPGSVAPFILRGITRCAIDRVTAPKVLREQAWTRLAQHLYLAKLDSLVREIVLSGAVDAAGDILTGPICGRGVVAMAVDGRR